MVIIKLVLVKDETPVLHCYRIPLFGNTQRIDGATFDILFLYIYIFFYRAIVLKLVFPTENFEYFYAMQSNLFAFMLKCFCAFVLDLFFLVDFVSCFPWFPEKKSGISYLVEFSYPGSHKNSPW